MKKHLIRSFILSALLAPMALCIGQNREGEVTATQMTTNSIQIQWSWNIIEGNEGSFKYFNIYRTSCDDAIGSNAELLASHITDTIYIDNNWNQAAQGSYKWGVSYVYSADKESLVSWDEQEIVSPIFVEEDFSISTSGGSTNISSCDIEAFRATTAYGVSVYEPQQINVGYMSFDVESLALNIINPAKLFYAGEYYDGYYYLATSGVPQMIYKTNPETGEIVASGYTEQTINIGEMTYDYSTNTMYAYAASSIDGYKLCTIDLETFEVSIVANLETSLRGLFCTTDGTMYAITRSEAEFVTINKSTGVMNVIGNFGDQMTPYHVSSACYDHNTGIAYMLSSETSAERFFKIDIAERKAIYVGDFYEIVGMYVPYTHVPSPESEITWSNCIEVTAVSDKTQLTASIYPNPTHGQITVQAQGMTQIIVSNTLGQIVYRKENPTDDTMIDLTSLEAGIYLVTVTTDNGKTTQKINLTK